MEHSFKDRKGLLSFVMLLVLFVLMVVCLIMTQALFKWTVPFLFGVANPDSFVQSQAEMFKNPPAMLYFQALCSSIGSFLLPVIIYHFIFRFDISAEMGLRNIPKAKYWIAGIGIMAMSAIFIQWLVQINTAIHLSGKLQELRTLQDQMDKILDAFFSENSAKRFLVLTLVMAILPALSEEFFFRGTVQNILAQTHLRITGAIVVSGLTFSLIHFEFNNFLGIWCMGIVLGCLYYYSGSIWVSITAHFFNNFMVVAGKFAYMQGLIKTDISNSDTLPIYITLPAGVIMTFGLIMMRKWYLKKSIAVQ